MKDIAWCLINFESEISREGGKRKRRGERIADLNTALEMGRSIF